MPETLTIDSQIPENLELSLAWGALSEAAPKGDFIRLGSGEQFKIPKGHATSVRTKEGWQRGYALEDTVVTGPVDISTPAEMSQREFLPLDTTDTPLGDTAGMLMLAGLGIGNCSAAIAVAEHGLIAQFSIVVVGVFFSVLVMRVFFNSMRGQDEKYGSHACPEASLKTFWREDLAWVQSQPIRAVSAA